MKGVFEKILIVKLDVSIGYLATSLMFVGRLVVYTNTVCIIKTITTLYLLQQLKTN